MRERAEVFFFLMSSKKATPPQKGPNLFSLFAKVAEKQQKGGEDGDAPKKQTSVLQVANFKPAAVPAVPRAPLKEVDNVADAAVATAAHTQSGRVVVVSEEDTRRISGGGGGGGLADQLSPQASVGDAFMTPAHPLRAQQSDVDGLPMMRDDDTPATTTTTTMPTTVSVARAPTQFQFSPPTIQGTPPPSFSSYLSPPAFFSKSFHVFIFSKMKKKQKKIIK